ncbi:MAG: putative serine/threonine protein kinase [Chlamydiales bacterium]|jgi:serine/threonine protein kinase|nr:putative serine/threonine protein kinase [Chlamydiales bacterium]
MKPAASVPSEEGARPTSIGPYAIEGLIKQGHTSLIYLASMPQDPSLLAIKVLAKAFLKEPEMVDRFFQEASIIALAQHPNIVKLYKYGRWQEGLYIAMEYIHGVTLQEWLNRPLSLKKALDLLLQIAYAVCHLHTHGIIHRDLKPENILVNAKGQIKLIDFGIAHLLKERAAEGALQASRLIGTPIYMSPEQRADPESVSYPSDVYSLGIIAYELFTGPVQKGKVQLSKAPLGLQKILSRALQPKVEERYSDIFSFISDIVSYMQSKDFSADQEQFAKTGLFFENFKQMEQRLLNRPHTHSIAGFKLHTACNELSLASGSYFSLFSSQSHSFPPHLIAMRADISKRPENALKVLYLAGAYQALAQNLPWQKALASFEHQGISEDISFLTLELGSHIRYSIFGKGEAWAWHAERQQFSRCPPQEESLALQPKDRLLILLTPQAKAPLPEAFLLKNAESLLIPFTEQILSYIEAISEDKQNPFFILCIEK